jgi:hypothetical protein
VWWECAPGKQTQVMTNRTMVDRQKQQNSNKNKNNDDDDDASDILISNQSFHEAARVPESPHMKLRMEGQC